MDIGEMTRTTNVRNVTLLVRPVLIKMMTNVKPVTPVITSSTENVTNLAQIHTSETITTKNVRNVNPLARPVPTITVVLIVLTMFPIYITNNVLNHVQKVITEMIMI